MHVIGNHDIKNPDNNESINANDLYIDLEDVNELDDFDIIARANAQAWDEEETSLAL